MKSNFNNKQNPLLVWFGRGFKYFSLMLVGLAIAFVVSHAFGIVVILALLRSPDTWTWIGRLAISLFCLFAMAMIFESWR
ncbi:hypothetical protein [Nostoc sp. TCL26-01]|uniref:hypothetical protein n=1 Tax=Nostoc sp. TCL26-01 TaxID=2576904 RepID=UPI002119B4C0|nr:hypothetical protein [Nostoc sp. TCL26-01]